METTILIIDDHDVFRMGLKLLLAEEEEMQIVGEAVERARELDLN